MCRWKHVEPTINFGIINSITKLHLVGISTESSTMHGSMNVKFEKNMYCYVHVLLPFLRYNWVDSTPDYNLGDQVLCLIFVTNLSE